MIFACFRSPRVASHALTVTVVSEYREFGFTVAFFNADVALGDVMKFSNPLPFVLYPDTSYLGPFPPREVMCRLADRP